MIGFSNGESICWMDRERCITVTVSIIDSDARSVLRVAQIRDLLDTSISVNPGYSSLIHYRRERTLGYSTSLGRSELGEIFWWFVLGFPVDVLLFEQLADDLSELGQSGVD